jgi:Sigma-70, region 4
LLHPGPRLCGQGEEDFQPAPGFPQFTPEAPALNNHAHAFILVNVAKVANMPSKLAPKKARPTQKTQIRKTSKSGLKAMVERLLALLAPRTRTVICDRFGLWGGLPDTLQEIGNRFGLTRERVRQIEVAGRNTLRAALPASLDKIIRSKVKASAVLRQGATVRVLAEDELRQAIADDCADYEASAAISLLQELWCPDESLAHRCLVQAEDHVYALTNEAAKEYRRLASMIRRRLLRAASAMSAEAVSIDDLAKSIRCAASDVARVVHVSPQFKLLSNGAVTLEGQPAYELLDFQKFA